MDDEILLELRGISKSFGATRALHQVDLTVRRAEAHALIGENGAGKSTLVKILSGAYSADSGAIYFEGEPCVVDSPSAGREHGIAMIYQELNLTSHLSVEENLTLGMEQSSFGFVRHQRGKIRQALELLQHPDLPLNEPVASLSIGLQQVVEIARALMSDARVIIMDEPTSSLTAADTEALFKVIRRLKETGVAVIYISHFLEEVTEIADTFTVLRDGEAVGTGRIADTDISQIIEMMVGRTLTEMFPRVEHEIGELVLQVEGVEGSPIPRGVSFELRRGEILGVAGLVGAGRSETLRTMFGLDKATAGTLTLTGTASIGLHAMNPSRALAMKIDFLSEDRKEEGLAVRMSVAENTTLSSVSRYAGFGGRGLLNPRTERFAVEQWIGAMRIQCLGSNQRVLDLSGGNQQKVALARMLQQGGDIILLDEPTRGIDVGSKVEVYRLIGKLAEQGRGIVFVSSYLPELLGICDTLAVMHRGLMSDIKPASEWTEHEIMRVATSGN